MKLLEAIYNAFEKRINKNQYQIDWLKKLEDEAEYKKSIDYCREQAIEKCRKNGKTYHILQVPNGYISLCKDDFEYLKKQGTFKKSATMVDVLRLKIETISYKNLK